MASRTRACIFSSSALIFRSRESAIRSVSSRRSTDMHSSTACLSSMLLRKFAATTSQRASGRFSPLIWARNSLEMFSPRALTSASACRRMARIIACRRRAVSPLSSSREGSSPLSTMNSARCMSPRSSTSSRMARHSPSTSTRTLLSGMRKTWRMSTTVPTVYMSSRCGRSTPASRCATTNRRLSPSNALSSAATERPRATSNVTMVLGKASSPRRGSRGSVPELVCFSLVLLTVHVLCA